MLCRTWNCASWWERFAATTSSQNQRFDNSRHFNQYVLIIFTGECWISVAGCWIIVDLSNHCFFSEPPQPRRRFMVSQQTSITGNPGHQITEFKLSQWRVTSKLAFSFSITSQSFAYSFMIRGSAKSKKVHCFHISVFTFWSSLEHKKQYMVHCWIHTWRSL